MHIWEKALRLFKHYPINDNYYHESGHVVMARIFGDIFTIKSVTLNEQLSRLKDPHALGGMSGTLAKPYKDLTNLDHDFLILIMLAGLCTDDINNSNGNITENFYQTEVWAYKLGSHRYSGDIELVARHFAHIKPYLKIEWHEYIVVTMKLLHEILQDDSVWDKINDIRDRIRWSPTKTLNQIEIKRILNQTTFNNWISDNMENITHKRGELFI